MSILTAKFVDASARNAFGDDNVAGARKLTKAFVGATFPAVGATFRAMDTAATFVNPAPAHK